MVVTMSRIVHAQEGGFAPQRSHSLFERAYTVSVSFGSLDKLLSENSRTKSLFKYVSERGWSA